MNQIVSLDRRASRHTLVSALALVLAALFIPRARAQTQLTGTVSVPTDQASPWDVGSDLYVGFLYTDGTLNIQSGSTVTDTGGYIGYAANGTVNVDGAGSTWTNNGMLNLGNYYSSVGKVYLTQGATASATSTVFGTASSTTQGLLSVDGTGSSFTTGNFFLGQTGSGSLSVTAGGAFATTSTGQSNYVGQNAGSSGAITVSGTGSTFTNASQLFLGAAATGTMTVANGAHAGIAGYTYLGYQSGASGTLTVSGTDAAYTSHDYVWSGYGGTGTLIVKDGGSIGFDAGSTQHVIQLGLNAGSTGTLKIGDGSAAGTVTAAAISGGSGTAQVVFNHTGAVGGGTYIFAPSLEGGLSVLHNGPGTTSLTAANTYTGGTTIDAGTLLANNTSGSATGTGAVTVNNGGTLGGAGFIGGLTTINSGGALAPGNSPGTLTFNDGLTLNDGAVLDFQLGTTSDLIAVTGGTLTGSDSAGGITLNLSDAGGFTSGTYTLLDYTAATATSGFDLSDFQLGTTIAGYDYSFALVDNSLELTANASASAVPEPSTYAALAGLCVLGFAVFRQRKTT